MSLAVRIESHQDDGRSSITAGDEEEEVEFESSGEIDEFLSLRGFEFIDVPASVDENRPEDEGVLAESQSFLHTFSHIIGAQLIHIIQLSHLCLVSSTPSVQ